LLAGRALGGQTTMSAGGHSMYPNQSAAGPRESSCDL
jgi:hypothetical protein